VGDLRTGPASAVVVILLGLQAAFGPLSSGLYMPALPALTKDLDATSAAGQLTLTLSLIGLGVGQFLWGPLSDRFGRRCPLLVGVAIFASASVACALAPTIQFLIAARFLQGLGGAAGVVVSRAIVRDLYGGHALARVYSRLLLAGSLASVLSPVLGTAILHVSDWRGVFIALAVFGTGLWLLSAWMLPETVAARVGPAVTLTVAAYLAPLRTRSFVLLAATLIISTSTVFTYLTFVSFVLQDERGLDEATFAVLYGMNACSILVGSQLVPMLVTRFRQDHLLVASLALSLAGSGGVTAASLWHWPLWALQGTLILTIMQLGIVSPVATSLALRQIRRSAGGASATLGGGQFLIGGVLTGSVASVANTSSVTMGLTMIVTSTAALILGHAGQRSQRDESDGGEPAPAPRLTSSSPRRD
jgi:MFS transporter, DHA1 family, multidrug resistance protein